MLVIQMLDNVSEVGYLIFAKTFIQVAKQTQACMGLWRKDSLWLFLDSFTEYSKKCKTSSEMKRKKEQPS